MNNKTEIIKYTLWIFFTAIFTLVWVKAWNWLTASDQDSLTYQKWNQLLESAQSWLPSWTIMAFDLTTCPIWWSKFNDADWRVIIWASDTTTPADTSTWKPELPARPFRDIWWSEYPPVDTNLLGINFYVSNTAGSSSIPSQHTRVLSAASGSPATAKKIYSSLLSSPISLGWVSLTNTQRDWAATDNMQPYIVLMYCKKN